MIRLIRRMWNYLVARGNSEFNQRADPKVQLEQAIQEAQQNHRQLKEQAANVIAHQKQTEIRLNRAMEEYEKIGANARQAVMMADDAQKKGDAAKMQQYTTAAEAFANRMIGIEREVEDLKALHLQASQAADQAKQAVNTNSSNLQKKLSERQKLLSQLDQAKMQEQLNKAMGQLSETVGEDTPSFAEIQDKIEGRYAQAKGAAELQEASIESRMLEVEQASLNVEANARLSEIRAQLGLEAAPAEAAAPIDTPMTEPAVAEGEPTT